MPRTRGKKNTSSFRMHTMYNNASSNTPFYNHVSLYTARRRLHPTGHQFGLNFDLLLVACSQFERESGSCLSFPGCVVKQNMGIHEHSHGQL